MELNDSLIADLMLALRVKSDSAKEEITDLAIACRRDLDIAGAYVEDFSEGLAKQALKLYCKANYGYDEDSEKYREAYMALRDAMALSGDYQKAGDDSV